MSNDDVKQEIIQLRVAKMLNEKTIASQAQEIAELKAQLERAYDVAYSRKNELRTARAQIEKLRIQRSEWIKKWALIECGEYPFTPETAKKYAKADDAEIAALAKEQK